MNLDKCVYVSMIKCASRREIREIQEDRLSNDSINRISQNNIGQRERGIEHIGSGFWQNADKVLLPGHGLVVRKTQQSAIPIRDLINSPEYRALERLQNYQQTTGEHGGFSRVIQMQPETGIHFHEYVRGQTPNEEQLASHLASPELNNTLNYLRQEFPRVSDYDARGNNIQTPTGTRSIDLQGDEDQNVLTDTGYGKGDFVTGQHHQLRARRGQKYETQFNLNNMMKHQINRMNFSLLVNDKNFYSHPDAKSFLDKHIKNQDNTILFQAVRRASEYNNEDIARQIFNTSLKHGKVFTTSDLKNILSQAHESGHNNLGIDIINYGTRNNILNKKDIMQHTITSLNSNNPGIAQHVINENMKNNTIEGKDALNIANAALKNGHHEIANKVLQHSVSNNLFNNGNDLSSGISNMIGGKHFDIAEHLIDHGVNNNLFTKNNINNLILRTNAVKHEPLLNKLTNLIQKY